MLGSTQQTQGVSRLFQNSTPGCSTTPRALKAWVGLWSSLQGVGMLQGANLQHSSTQWAISPGVGSTKPISSIPVFFSIFFFSNKEITTSHWISDPYIDGLERRNSTANALELRLYCTKPPIWWVLLPLSSSDTCQIWMEFKGYKLYFYRIRNISNGKLNKQISGQEV